MKKLIKEEYNGEVAYILYDTEKAEKIFSYDETNVYKTKNDNYFFINNSLEFKDIVPITEDEAKDLFYNHLIHNFDDIDKFIELFGYDEEA